MKNEKRRRLSRYAKTGSAAALLTAAFMGLAACAGRPAVGSWDNAGLAAEQRLVIEQQQRRLEDMGGAIGQVQDSLGRAVDELRASLDGSGDLKSQFAAIDEFVRTVIESKRILEELQRPDSGEDAGER